MLKSGVSKTTTTTNNINLDVTKMNHLNLKTRFIIDNKPYNIILKKSL